MNRIHVTLMASSLLAASCSRSPAPATPTGVVPAETPPAMAVTASREPAVSPPGPLPFPPRALRYTRGGNVSMAVEFNGTEVRHRSVGGFGPQQGKVFSEGTAAPSAETWQRVHALLGEAGAWTWSATYSSAASRQTDGVGWELWINGADDRVFHARGYNAAPPNLNDVERALAALYAPP